MDATPASLLNRLAGPRDPEAWSRFVDLFAPLLHGWLRGFNVNGSDADDILQDTFLVLYRDLPRFERRGPGSFRAWLYMVLRNRWRDHLRKSARTLAPLVGEAAGPDPAPPGEDEYRTHLCGRALRVLRRDYAEPTWRGFWATVVEGRPVAEVARELGTSANALYLARGRILRRLRVELTEFLE